MRKEELQEILEKHMKWLKDMDGGECADLRYADLRYADLRGANLYGANLYGVDLQDANLRGANLRYADLRGANLRGANLRGANLQDANLQDANLRGANLRGANLQDANLQRANLRYANGIPLSCPEEGAFIGWKKAYKNNTEYLVKLEIPADAKRSSATSRKCRCDKANVLEVYTMDSKVVEETVHSGRDADFMYQKGQTVSVDNFEEDRWMECAPGIHFFITKQEAIDY
jgi:uncharacterized protein YjbI with pentapeptide repeats